MGKRETMHLIFKADETKKMQVWVGRLTRLGLKLDRDFEIRDCFDAEHHPAKKVVWDRDRYFIAAEKEYAMTKKLCGK